MSSLASQKKLVEQLRVEAGTERTRVSDCVKDIMEFIQKNEDHDVLVHGFATKKDNPFQEKSSCTVL